MLTTSQKEAVKNRDGRKCVKCGTPNDLTVDHIVPLSKGGTDEFGNLETLCHTHNTMKASNYKSFIKQLQDLWSNYYGSARWRKEIDIRIRHNNKHVEKVVQEYVDKIIKPKLQSMEDRIRVPKTALPALTADCICGHHELHHITGTINLCTRCTCNRFNLKK